jgi:HPt (histidine-containing phosphotransfer) domain-containing protein
MPILHADYSNLNHAEMAVSIGLKPKHMPMLIGSFLEESVSILENLGSAITSNSYSDIKLHSHSIKGSAGNLKFTEIYEMSKELEHAGTTSDSNFDYSAYLTAIKEAVGTIQG